MNRNRILKQTFLILALALVLALTANPWKLPKLETNIPLVTPLWNWIQDSRIHLGLDLQGGTQLDYEIDLKNAHERNSDDNSDNDVDVSALLEGVKDVIERRVNSLGVAEPNIYLSSVGEEWHIVVELPGIKDLEVAKQRVGEVVQLQFKTEKAEAQPEEVKEIEQQALALLRELEAQTSVEDLEVFLEDKIVPNQVEYKHEENLFLDQLPVAIQDLVDTMKIGEFYQEVVRSKESGYIYNNGQFQQPEGLNIVRLKEISTELRKRPINAEPFDEVLTELEQKASDEWQAEENITPVQLQREIASLDVGQITGVVETEQGFFIGNLVEKMGVSEEDEPQIHTAHILIKAPQTDTPTLQVEGNTAEGGIVNATVEGQEELQGKKDEARKQAEKVLQELQTDPLRFAELAQEYSEDEGSAVKGGDLGYAVPSTYVQAYREAALALEPGETTSELVESEFGFHIIKLIDLKNPDDLRFKYSALQVCYQGASGCDSQLSKEEAQTKADELLRRVREEKIYSVERVWFNAVPDPWQETELDGRYFKHASVAYDQTNNRPYVAITFNGEGAKLFEELTEANIGKPIGIFVGGEFISSPTVQEKIAGGNAQITLGQPNPQLALKEANELARSLNAGSIPAPLKKPNELTIGASLGQQSLEKSIQAGLIGFLLLASFMILYYRFLGVLACLSLLIYGLLLVFVIQSEISPALAILFTFVLWIAFALRLFKSKIDFFAKCIFLTLSIVGVYFIFSVLVNPIVLTLAGVAGLILSISMAIDANILIYERMKEEFRAGKSFVSVVHDGFERAWSSILDSNVSTLITCGILNYFGSSFIRGFAVNLAIGIVISMFTAVTVSRIFLLLCHDTKLERISWLWKK